MAKQPLRYIFRDLPRSPLTDVMVDQPAVGGVGQVDLWNQQSLPDIPDWVGLSKSLFSAYSQIKKESNEQEFDKGKSAAVDNRQAFKDAFREGAIPKNADPYFISGYRTVLAKRYHDEAEKLFIQNMEEKTKLALKSQTNAASGQKPLPIAEEVWAEVKGILSGELEQGNPTLYNDKWFNNSLADISLRDENRIIHNAKIQVDKANEKIINDTFTLDVIDGINKVADGRMSIENFNNDIATNSIYSSNIDNPQAFVWNAAQAAYQAELRNIDQDTGEPKNPERIKKLYDAIGAIKLGNNLLVNGPASDNYTAMAGKWVNKKTASERATDEFLKLTHDPTSPFHAIAISRDKDFIFTETNKVLDILTKDPESIGVPFSRSDIIKDKLRKLAWDDKEKDLKPVDNSFKIAQAQGLAMLGKTDAARLFISNLPAPDKIVAENKIREASAGVLKDIMSNKTYKDKMAHASKTAKSFQVDTTPQYLNAFSDFSDVLIDHAQKRISETGRSDHDSISSFLNEGLSTEEVTKFLGEVKTKREQFRLSLMDRTGEDRTDWIEQHRMRGDIDDSEYKKAKQENLDNNKVMNQIRSSTPTRLYRMVKSEFETLLGTKEVGGEVVTNTDFYSQDPVTKKIFMNAAGKKILNKAKSEATDNIMNAFKGGLISNAEELTKYEDVYAKKAMQDAANGLDLEDDTTDNTTDNKPISPIGPLIPLEDKIPDSTTKLPEIPFTPMLNPSLLDMQIGWDKQEEMINKYIPKQYVKAVKVKERYRMGMLDLAYVLSNETYKLDLPKLIPLDKTEIFPSKDSFKEWFNSSNQKDIQDKQNLMKRYGYNADDQLSATKFYIQQFRSYPTYR